MKNCRLYPVLVAVLVLVSAGCMDPIEIEPPSPSGGTLSATIDGAPFSVSGLQVSAEYQEISIGVSSLFVGGATLPIGGSTEALALAMVRTDSMSISDGDVFSGGDMTRLGAGEYSLEAGIFDIKAVSETIGIASMTVTSLDFVTGLVSGTFSFDAVDEDDPTTVYEIRDGVFTNIPLD